MILVFKTNIDTKDKIHNVEPILNNIADEIKWNFDLEDDDNILRIDTYNNIAQLIIKKLGTIGFYCEELL